MAEQVTPKKQRVALTVEDDPTQFIEFEATISEGHSGETEATNYPIEGSSDASDHIGRKPETLVLEVVISDTPIAADAGASVPGGSPDNRASDAWAFLRGIKDNAKLVRVDTRLQPYSGMFIKILSTTKDKDTSNIVAISITLRELSFGTAESVKPPDPVVKVRTTAPSELGKKNKAAVSESTADKSLETAEKTGGFVSFETVAEALSN